MSRKKKIDKNPPLDEWQKAWYGDNPTFIVYEKWRNGFECVSRHPYPTKQRMESWAKFCESLSAIVDYEVIYKGNVYYSKG